MAKTNFHYDDTRLRKLLEDLSRKQRAKAMEDTIRRGATELRRQAVSSLRSSGLNTNRDVEKGIRRVIWKKSLGFDVRLGGREKRRKRSKDDRRRVKLAIVPMWAEGGTEERYRKTTRYGFRYKSKNQRRSTGRLKPYSFMERLVPDTERISGLMIKKLLAVTEKAVLKAGGEMK